jgi:hypothetical protein
MEDPDGQAQQIADARMAMQQQMPMEEEAEGEVIEDNPDDN